jgi:branched-subunit amino acid aminotransferase/4-amino-4-deoxychorismate lyase
VAVTNPVLQMNGLEVTTEELRALGLQNYGHFTTLRVEEGLLVKGFSLHLRRLARDSQKLFGVEVEGARVRALLRRAAQQLNLPVVVRVTVFDSAGDLEHPGATSQPDVLISVRPPPLASGISPLRVETVRYQREVASVKHIALFGPLFYRRAAQLRGFDDALFIDHRSEVSEGTTWNIGFFDGSQVIWPDADVLPGTTVNLLQSAMTGNEMPFTIRAVNISEISADWTAFATNAAVGVRPIHAVNDVALVENSPVIRELQLLYGSIPGEPV